VDKIWYSQTGHRWQCSILQKRSDLHAGQLSQEYRHTLIIFNAYCSSAAITVTRTRLIGTLYILCLSCCIIWTNCCIYTVYAETISSLYYPRHIYTSGHQKFNKLFTFIHWICVSYVHGDSFVSVKNVQHERRFNAWIIFFPVCETSHFCVCVKLYTFATVQQCFMLLGIPYFPAHKTHFFSRKMWPKLDVRLMRQG
jgi:hypothetical protein